VASFSREELQHGVNLALYKTPMLDQAHSIDWTEDRRATLDQARFILSAEAKASPTSAIAEATLQQAQDELATAVRKDSARSRTTSNCGASNSHTMAIHRVSDE